MLTYPDRERFEQLRARWETPGSPSSSMAGRKNKQSVQQQSIVDPSENNVGARFRRKLSYGLYFISNPLSQQRKTSHGQQPANVESLASQPLLRDSPEREKAVEEPAALVPTVENTSLLTDATTSERECHDSQVKSSSHLVSNLNLPHIESQGTPRPSIRSDTLSYIPRPSRNGTESSVNNMDGPDSSPVPPQTARRFVRNTPTRIPTPSPPKSNGSPRQYLRDVTSKHTKDIQAGIAFAQPRTLAPSNASSRSHTTPNLLKSTPQKSFMTLRKTPRVGTNRNSDASKVPYTPQKPGFRNTSRWTPQKKENIQRHGSLHPLGRIQSIQSHEQGTNRSENGEGESSRAVLDSHCMHDRRLKVNNGVKSAKRNTKHNNQHADIETMTSNVLITQTRLMGPVSPQATGQSSLSSGSVGLPRSCTDIELGKDTLDSTPTKSHGPRRALRSRDSSYKVRLPRSSTFHTIRTACEDVPPVPRIPERFMGLSQPDLTTFRGRRSPSFSRRHLTLDTVQEASPPPSSSSVPELSRSAQSSPFQTDPDSGDISFDDRQNGRNVLGSSNKPLSQFEFSFSNSVSAGNDANSHLETQIQDSMPPAWWAGRFQTRFDQWRTEAMKAELNPLAKSDGALGLKLDDEATAACLIFVQLRELCATRQAACSLWAFESRYRREHHVLGAMTQLPPLSMPTQNDNKTTKEGGFTRAVRKLTPRKNSFVNLLKGKGWNRTEEQSYLFARDESNRANGDNFP
ncbi:hypothetical protein BU24DRAFT_462424 [Aaosphaeria arxii CBS 175.79]|uniref:Uncharacterized protein n=1 Tax=Aaosphaeria arxii CBS 175.79 TaxID=1450172 RepID=A0A6A5XVF9_9PLEO|nr:uncharacterized protein BU24DRAFT_462424 [Aaosphaeria arxii CBS 175.79]KAF2016244.1 hypothetical protein BU24DRAFT_462424 [Aaosphaeria arxii CBS 175.79]